MGKLIVAMPRICYFCKKEINLPDKIQFREECPNCRRDLHICWNCRNFDESAYHQCREPQAEYVAIKEKSNLCEYFEFREGHEELVSPRNSRAEAEELWKKVIKKI